LSLEPAETQKFRLVSYFDASTSQRQYGWTSQHSGEKAAKYSRPKKKRLVIEQTLIDNDTWMTPGCLRAQ